MKDKTSTQGKSTNQSEDDKITQTSIYISVAKLRKLKAKLALEGSSIKKFFLKVVDDYLKEEEKR